MVGGTEGQWPPVVKKDVKSKVAAKKWLAKDKNFNNGNSGEFVCQIIVKHGEGNTNLPELLLLKLLPLAYHHSHFLAATFGFHIFFTTTFLGAVHFFLQLGCLGLDIICHIVTVVVSTLNNGVSIATSTG